ncbi:MAG: O-antigen ligase family protein, partial [Thermoanaerobaculia bacterium]
VKAGRLRHFALPLLAAMLSCLALTQQRGAWAAAAIQVAVWMIWFVSRWRRERRGSADIRRAALAAATVLVLVGTVVIAAGALQPVKDRALSIRSGLTPRLALWQAAVEMTGERPVLGWGLGSFAVAYDLHYPPGSAGAREKRGTAHSLYLNTAAEAGVLGLAALAMLGWAAASCVRRPRAGEETMALALGISLIGVAAYGLVQQMFYLRSVSWAIWLLLGSAAVVTSATAAGRPIKLARALTFAALALTPLRLLAVDPAPLAGTRSFGFHETERDGVQPFRWTEGFAALRIPPPSESLTLAFANGHPKAAERPVTVVVGVNGETVSRLSVSGGWETHTLEIETAGRQDLVLTLEARPTFRPFSDFLSYPDLDRSTDIRSLGIAVRLPSHAERVPQ